MKDSFENEPKIGFIRPSSVTYKADGQTVVDLDVATTPNVSAEEIRSDIAKIHGTDPENVQVVERRGRNKSRASFGRWNSSWVPKADNAHLN